MKKIIAKLLYKYFEYEIIDIMSSKADEDAKQEAIKTGYTEKDWQEYFIDKTQESQREAYDAGKQDGFEKGYEAGLRVV